MITLFENVKTGESVPRYVRFCIAVSYTHLEDAVQETFVQYYTSRKEFENEQHIRAWLLRVVINKAKNINRTFWKKNKCSLEDYMETLSFPDSQSRDLFEMCIRDRYTSAA